MKRIFRWVIAPVAGLLMTGCEGIEPPYAVTTLEPTKVGALEATLNGSFERSPLASDYRVTKLGFYLSTTADAVETGIEYQASGFSSGSTSEEFSKMVTSLYAETTYYVVAYVQSSELDYHYGKEISFETEELINTGTFTDPRDGKVYKWVTIGKETWMAENLAWMPLSSPNKPDMGSDTEEYYYVYGNDGTYPLSGDDYYKTFGVLYNHSAAMTACPSGWKLPLDTEWEEMVDEFPYPEGGALKEAGTVHWDPPNQDADNLSDFTALPGGQRYFNGGFMRLRTHAYFWTATMQVNNYYWAHVLESSHGRDIRGAFPIASGFSVRCIKVKSE
jgi:uncharacterized protein (TIGR02145 family)